MVAVLVLAFCVVLAGFVRLRFYQRQVMVRLDRQREVQQSFATRSALTWLSVDKVGKLPVVTNRLGFETLRGDIGVSVCPAPDIFPEAGTAEHYDSSDADSAVRRKPENYPYVSFSGPDANVADWISTVEGSSGQIRRHGIVLGDKSSAVGSTNLVEIDLSDSFVDALWTVDPYGRRYMVQFSDICQGTATNEGDVVFFGLTPRGQALTSSGKGWKADVAVWMEQLSPSNAIDQTTAPVAVWVRSGGVDAKAMTVNALSAAPKGLQMSGTHATVFDRTRIVNDNEKAIQSTHTYDSHDLGDAYTRRFAAECGEAGGVRLTLGVAIRRPRDDDAASDSLLYDRFTRVAVTPAYEYETVLDWEEMSGGRRERCEERSTVVRVDIRLRPNDSKPRTVTYDTHGTYATRKRQVR